MSVLSALKPEKVFYYFEQLCSVPHGSGNTKIISDLIVSFAKQLGLRFRQDELNNVVIWKDASPGYENAETVILQGHMDMVCAKTADCAKDMAVEGLNLCTDGEYIWADKTTLGGDNCIAVAIALAVIADKELKHPALEAIFTVDEETGMDGAFGLDCSDIMGRRLLNLDSEEEGVFTVSCAGGMRADCEISGEMQSIGSETCYKLELKGLLGGHSGAEIHTGRANANVLMLRCLYNAMDILGGIRLSDVRGGKFDNVICDSSMALVAVESEKAPAFESFATGFNALLKNEYAACDAGVSFSCERADFDSAFTVDESRRILSTLYALPQGVQEMSHEFKGLTQTSLNMGIISVENSTVHFTYSLRSCIASQKQMMLQKLQAILALGGGTVTVRSSYPGWQYQRESAFRDLLISVYTEQTGREPRIEATHGGLECGLFMEKMPGLDAVSIGPDMKDIHSPNEKLHVASTARLYELVCELLRRSK